MTPSILQWISDARQRCPFEAGNTLEVGSYDVNGNPRHLFADATQYIGVDARPGPNVDYAADAERLPFADASFDTVVCCELLEHVRNPLAVIAEIVRVLRPGGYLVASSPANGFQEHRYPRDYWRLMPDAWKELVFEGFQIVAIQMVRPRITCALGRKLPIASGNTADSKAAGDCSPGPAPGG